MASRGCAACRRSCRMIAIAAARYEKPRASKPVFSQNSFESLHVTPFSSVALCLCAPRAGSRMRGDRPSPWIRFRTPSPALSTSRPRHSAGCIAIVSPRNHSLGSALVSVGWHLDPLLPLFCYFLLFVLFVTSRYGISGAHWDSGSAGGTGAGHARAVVFPAGSCQLASCCGPE